MLACRCAVKSGCYFTLASQDASTRACQSIGDLLFLDDHYRRQATHRADLERCEKGHDLAHKLRNLHVVGEHEREHLANVRHSERLRVGLLTFFVARSTVITMAPARTLTRAERCPANLAPAAERLPMRLPTRADAATPVNNIMRYRADEDIRGQTYPEGNLEEGEDAVYSGGRTHTVLRTVELCESQAQSSNSDDTHFGQRS